jgi:hypothetical protein
MTRFDDSRDDALPAGGDALQRSDPLREALDHAAAQPPVADVDWTALHARIRAAAKPTLAALTAANAADEVRRRNHEAALGRHADAHGLLQPLAGWSPFGIPLAAAATVLLMVGAALIGTEPLVSDDMAFHTIEEEFMAGLGNGAAPFLATAGADDMLDAVLFYDREEW